MNIMIITFYFDLLPQYAFSIIKKGFQIENLVKIIYNHQFKSSTRKSLVKGERFKRFVVDK